jgi:autotransporter strand-loop-strand O-heptosyltransferase
MKTKLLFLAPHLSTGGMPQFLLKRIELLNQIYEIYVVEYECLSDIYVVQRNKIMQLPIKGFWSLGDYKLQLLDIINDNHIDIVHIEHEAEGFDKNLINLLYSDNRKYKIVETCHNVSFNPKGKIFTPDGLAFCTPYHFDTFIGVDTYKSLLEYPIEEIKNSVSDIDFSSNKLGINPNELNVLNVGLWCKGKNQSQAIEIAKKNPKYNFHFVGNKAMNFEEYWKPLMEDLPENVKVWGERDDVNDFMKVCKIFMFNSIHECNPLVLKEAISNKMQIYANNLPQYKGFYDQYITPIEYFSIDIDKTYSISENQNDEFILNHCNFYSQILNNTMKKQSKLTYKFINNFVDGVYFEIVGSSESNFKVEFSDGLGVVMYDEIIKCNTWIKLNRKYYTDWSIKVWENDQLVYNETISLKNKKVMICFESSSLGDTLAWMPYCDEFQKKHDCELFVSTFKNFLFTDQYPNINFIEPATVVNNLEAKYDLGWFYDFNKEPTLPNTIPLQQTATNILGLEYSEIKPKLNFDFSIINNASKSVCIAPNSTAGCKEWVKESWQEVVDYLVSQEIIVYNVSKEQNYDLNGITPIVDYSIENTMSLIHNSEYLIGLSSGISWLAWSLNKHVFMIANFSKANHEFTTDCNRIINESVCNGCWNNPNFKFDKGDWNWCPINKNLPKMFECQKSISSLMVIQEIESFIK